MKGLTRIAITGTIAVLFGIFIFALINAVYEKPRYEDYCYEKPFPVKTIGECEEINYSSQQELDCRNQSGYLQPVYEDGCVVEYYCETCQKELNLASEKYSFFTFLMASILGLMAVFASIYMPQKKDSLKECILAGFLIGGLASIFIGTGEYFQQMHRILKPLIMLLEIILVIFIAYKKFGKQK